MTRQNSEYYAPEYEDDFDDEMLEFDDDFSDDDESAEFDDDFDDDESAEFDDDFGDDDEAGGMGEDAEFLPFLGGAASIPLIGRGIRGAIKGISSFVKKRPRGRRLPSSRFLKGSPAVGFIRKLAGRSNLSGTIRNRRGQRVRFRLPKNVATKIDVRRLQGGVNRNAKAIRSTANGVKANAKSVLATNKKVTLVDRKHIAATTNQNRILGSVNKRVNSLKKELASMKQQSQMQMMMPLLLGNNELKSLTVEPKTGAPDAFGITPNEGVFEVTASDSGDNDNLPLILAMSGGLGGSSGGSGMMNNPLMMMLLMDSFK